MIFDKQMTNAKKSLQPFWKKAALYFGIGVTLLLLSFSITGTWRIPPHSMVNFNVKGVFGKVKGTLEVQNATINFDPKAVDKAKMDVTISVSTINTGINKRDNHLRTDDFFDAVKYPSITFHSTQVKKQANNSYAVVGQLTIKNVTRSVEIPFTFSVNGNKGIFKGRFTINRMDYKVGEKQKAMIGKKITILLDIPVVQ